MIMNCNLCQSEQVGRLITFGSYPIAHQYMQNLSDKRDNYPFNLSHCRDCNHVFVEQPIAPDVLYQNYVTLSDWKFQPHVPRLIELLYVHGVSRKANILEVGCNDGHFLEVLRGEGFASLTGIEPTDDASHAAKQKGINIIKGFFNDETAQKYLLQKTTCDVFIIRQVLEHIYDLSAFYTTLKKIITPGTLVLIEVPDFSVNLSTRDYALWEEHVNYFTRETLHQFLDMIGVKEIHYERFLFSGVGQVVLGRAESFAQVKSLFDNQPENARIKDTQGDAFSQQQDGLMKLIKEYAEDWEPFKKAMSDYFSLLVTQGKKIALYGAGNRTANFVNFIGLAKYIEFVVDDQLEKQGLFMPGSNLEILPSDALHASKIDVCFLGVNTENENKVIERHHAVSNGGIQFYSILPPSEHLIPFWNEWIVKLKSSQHVSVF